MTSEAFEREILYCLKAQRLRTSAMQPEDVVNEVTLSMPPRCYTRLPALKPHRFLFL